MKKYSLQEVNVCADNLNLCYKKEKVLLDKIRNCENKKQKEKLIKEFNELDFHKTRSKFFEAFNNCDNFYTIP